MNKDLFTRVVKDKTQILKFFKQLTRIEQKHFREYLKEAGVKYEDLPQELK